MPIVPSFCDTHFGLVVQGYQPQLYAQVAGHRVIIQHLIAHARGNSPCDGINIIEKIPNGIDILLGAHRTFNGYHFLSFWLHNI